MTDNGIQILRKKWHKGSELTWAMKEYHRAGAFGTLFPNRLQRLYDQNVISGHWFTGYGVSKAK